MEWTVLFGLALLGLIIILQLADMWVKRKHKPELKWHLDDWETDKNKDPWD